MPVADEMAARYTGPDGPEQLKMSWGWERYLVRLVPRDGRLLTWQGADWALRYFDPGQRPTWSPQPRPAPSDDPGVRRSDSVGRSDPFRRSDSVGRYDPFRRSDSVGRCMRAAGSRAAGLRRSEIRILFDAAARAGDGVIRLEVGEPSFTTPSHVIEAAAAAARAGHTGYGPNGGLASLRELLSEKLRRVNGIEASPEEIVVTPGAMNALYSVYLALLEPGDEVLLPTPGFPNMDEMVRLLGGRPVFYPLAADEHFLPDVAALDALVTARTKMLFVNTPANPTGAVYPARLMGDLVEFCARHDLWLLCDEVYDEMVLSPGCVHTAAAPLDSDGRVITVCSFSKVYAMTGWRVGYAAAPAGVAELLRTLQEPQVSCPSTISQKAAEAALTGPRPRTTPCSRPTADGGPRRWRRRRGRACGLSPPTGPCTCWWMCPVRGSTTSTLLWPAAVARGERGARLGVRARGAGLGPDLAGGRGGLDRRGAAPDGPGSARARAAHRRRRGERICGDVIR